MTGDGKGYGDVRHNRSQLAALDRRDSREPPGVHDLSREESFSIERLDVLRFFLSRRPTAYVKIKATAKRSAWQDS